MRRVHCILLLKVIGGLNIIILTRIHNQLGWIRLEKFWEWLGVLLIVILLLKILHLHFRQRIETLLMHLRSIHHLMIYWLNPCTSISFWIWMVGNHVGMLDCILGICVKLCRLSFAFGLNRAILHLQLFHTNTLSVQNNHLWWRTHLLFRVIHANGPTYDYLLLALHFEF